MENVFDIIVLITCLGSGLIGGAFFVFSVMVMPALGKLSPPEGIRSMQAINVAAVRPAFMLAFMGTTVLSLVLGIRSAIELQSPGATLALIACAVYFFGSFVLTAGYHVPRNNALAAMDPQSATAQEYWRTYQQEWTRMNHLRAVASTAASIALTFSLTY